MIRTPFVCVCPPSLAWRSTSMTPSLPRPTLTVIREGRPKSKSLSPVVLFAKSVDKFSVVFHVVIIPIDSVVEVCLDLEEQAKVGVGNVESLVYLMVARQDNFHVQRYRLRGETLCTRNAEPLARFF